MVYACTKGAAAVMSLTLDEARQLVERLKLFAQPQRLIIVDALLAGPLAVSELEAKTGIGQPTLSQQLGTLRRADIVMPRRESRAIYYSLANAEEVLRAKALIGLLRQDRDAGPLLCGKAAPKQAVEGTYAPPYAGGGAQFARIIPPVDPEIF